MVWRKWNVIVVLVLANYLVFAMLGTLVFTDSNSGTRTRAADPTFTPRPTELKRVSPLPYDFGTPTLPRGTATLATGSPTVSATSAPLTATPPTAPATLTPSGPTATLIRPTPTETVLFATPAPAFGQPTATPSP